MWLPCEVAINNLTPEQRAFMERNIIGFEFVGGDCYRFRFKGDLAGPWFDPRRTDLSFVVVCKGTYQPRRRS